MTRFPRPFLLPLLSLLIAGCAPVPDYYESENLSQQPFNQLVLAGNACGPAALLNSYRFGNSRWKKLSENPPALSDRERIRAIARGPAMRESSSLPGRARWSRSGINLADLRDVANEIGAAESLPHLSEEMLFLRPGETQEAHLQRVHRLLARSLAEGIPPILSIRRFVKRDGKWSTVHSHFVTVVSVPGRLPAGKNSFSVKYIDPWGGKLSEGEIAIRERAFLGESASKNPNLEAVFPNAIVGKSQVSSGQETMLAVSSVLGRL